MDAADLVVLNGLGVEEGLVQQLDRAAAAGASLLAAGDMIDVVPYSAGDAAGAPDPHFRTDPGPWSGSSTPSRPPPEGAAVPEDSSYAPVSEPVHGRLRHRSLHHDYSCPDVGDQSRRLTQWCAVFITANLCAPVGTGRN